jgi:hypothetical protein
MTSGVISVLTGCVCYDRQLCSFLARQCRCRVVSARSDAGGGHHHHNNNNNNNNNNNDQRNNNGCNGVSAQRKPTLTSLCGKMAVIIAVYTLVAFPVHVVQQTRPRTIRAYDGFGPPAGRDTAAALNSKSWSASFLVERPTDPLGFFGVWWRQHGRQWDKLLTFI